MTRRSILKVLVVVLTTIASAAWIAATWANGHDAESWAGTAFVLTILAIITALCARGDSGL